MSANLPEGTIRSICERMWLNRVRRRQLLYTEGNLATHLYAVRAGRVKLSRVDVGGREHVTAILEPGDMFGFEAAFDESYSTAAEALTDGELCLASGEELRDLMQQVPSIAVDLARYLHHQLCRTRAGLAYLTAPGAPAKLAGYLLHELLGQEEQAACPLEIPHDLTLRELGGILGLSAETVCRTLARLETERAIESLPSRIRVTDLAVLRRLAGS